VRKLDRTGEIRFNNQGCEMVIIVYRNCEDIDIQFKNGTILTNRQYHHFKNGNMPNPLHPTILNIGYEGVGKYSFISYPVIYKLWKSIVRRTSDKLYKESHNSYRNSSLSQEWHNFQNFAQWFEENYVEGFHLDKDILVKGNKIYSPETCRFVPQEINNLFTNRLKKRGLYPLGVTITKYGKFVAQITKFGVRTRISTFNTPEEAFNAYKTAKEEYIKEVAEIWKDRIDSSLYRAMYNWIIEIND